MSNGNRALPLALGAGGGFLVWHFLADDKRRAAPEAAAPSQAVAACALRLDASGLTADDARVGVAEAVNRCKLAGRADVTVIQEASAAVYADLMIALGRAGIPVHAHRNVAGPRNASMNQDRPPVWFAGPGAEGLDKLYLAQRTYLANLRGADRLAPEPDMTGGVMLIPRSTNGDVLQLAEFWKRTLDEPKAKHANGYDTVRARWSAVQRDIEAYARDADPGAVYPKNHAFWRAAASVAVHVSASLKYGLSDAQRWMASVGEGLQTSFDRTAQAVQSAGKVLGEGARGLLGRPLLIGGGIAAAILLLRGRRNAAHEERSR